MIRGEYSVQIHRRLLRLFMCILHCLWYKWVSRLLLLANFNFKRRCTVCSISLFFKSSEGTQEITSTQKKTVYWNVASCGLVVITEFRTNALHPTTLKMEPGLNYSTLSSTTSENVYQTIRRHIQITLFFMVKVKVKFTLEQATKAQRGGVEV